MSWSYDAYGFCPVALGGRVWFDIEMSGTNGTPGMVTGVYTASS